jgi:hypothetical protein
MEVTELPRRAPAGEREASNAVIRCWSTRSRKKLASATYGEIRKAKAPAQIVKRARTLSRKVHPSHLLGIDRLSVGRHRTQFALRRGFQFSNGRHKLDLPVFDKEIGDVGRRDRQ